MRVKLKLDCGITIEGELEGVTLQTITDVTTNGENCNVTRNSVIIKDADLQLRGSALMLKTSDGEGFIQQLNYPAETLTNNQTFVLPDSSGVITTE